jgi:DNA gyrase/topoisomerase IV subunit B
MFFWIYSICIYQRRKLIEQRQQRVNVPKFKDANEAGGRYSEECTLIFTEGDSAKALAISSMINNVLCGKHQFNFLL